MLLYCNFWALPLRTSMVLPAQYLNSNSIVTANEFKRMSLLNLILQLATYVEQYIYVAIIIYLYS